MDRIRSQVSWVSDPVHPVESCLSFFFNSCRSPALIMTLIRLTGRFAGMPDSVELLVGQEPWTLTILGDRRVELQREPLVAPSRTPPELVRDALEQPFEFEAMRRALTPDDHIAIVLDANLPKVAALLAEVLDHLRIGGGATRGRDRCSPPPVRPQDWIDELPDEYADVRTEIHDPTDRRKLAYLATTGKGRRVYLNRTLVDADFAIVLSGRGYDPLTGYAGAEGAIFPTLSDEETRESFAGQFSTVAPGEEPWPTREEASEILWLLGTPFLVQVIAESGRWGAGGRGRPADSECRRHPPPGCALEATMDEAPDTVIVAISGAARAPVVSRPRQGSGLRGPRRQEGGPHRGTHHRRPRPGRGAPTLADNGRPHRREAAPGTAKARRLGRVPALGIRRQEPQPLSRQRLPR